MKKLMCFSSIFSLVPARLVFQEAPHEAPPQPTGGKKKFKFKKKKGDDSPDETPKPDHKEAADKVKDASRTEQEQLKAEVEQLKGELERAESELQKMSRHELSPDSPEGKALLQTLQYRFNVRPELYEHPEGVKFAEVKKALEKQPALLWSLNKMEQTGGAPDVIEVTATEFIFADTSQESPIRRRNLNYADAAKMAAGMGVQMMTPEMYSELQKKLQLDFNSWSWLFTDQATLDTGRAMRGYRDDDAVRVREFRADARYPYGGFRVSLRVHKS